MHKKWIILASAAAVLLLAAVLIWDGMARETAQTFFAMDTLCSLRLTGPGGKRAAASLIEATEDLESETLSRQIKRSELARLNADGGGTLSPLLADALRQMLEIHEASGGAFDPTLGAVSDCWDFTGTPAVPDPQTLRGILAHTGARKLHLSGNTLTIDDPALVLDPGAVGKGLALDVLREQLEQTHLRSAVISLGGSVLLWGDRTFNVGIRTPGGNPGESMATLALGACCVSTSGSYERCFEQDGVRYHHILDPATGMPVQNGLVSVTVVSESGLLSDALSTACFVLGVEKGMALAEACDCGAVFVEETGRVTVSDDLRGRIELTDSDYSLSE